MKAKIEPSDVDADSVETVSSLRTVIAYDDVEAGQHAMRMMAQIGKGLGETIDFEPIAWSFDLLADTNWSNIAASDAVKADILIIASSSAGALPRPVGRWTQRAIDRKRGSTAAVVALFGPAENPDGAESARLETIRSAAQQAGLSFFAPAPRRRSEEAIARIEGGHEMLMPQLQEIDPQQPPPPRWGINE